MKSRKCIIVCCILVFGLVGCSKDSPTTCFGGTWAQELSNELLDWTAAAQEYGDNPTIGNCSSYKSSVNTYLKALDRIKNCVPKVNLGDFNDSIDEAKEELNQIDC